MWNLFNIMITVALAQSAITSTEVGQKVTAQAKYTNIESKCAKLELLKNTLAQEIISFKKNPENQMPTIRRIYKTPSDCANFIIGYQDGQILLSSGKVISIHNNTIKMKSETLFTDSNAEKGLIEGRGISQYYNFDYRFLGDKKVEYYLGIRNELHRSAVFLFDSDSENTTELITSNRDILSVFYFPDPDTPGGSIGLTIRDRGETYLIDLHWYHPEIYGKRR